MYVRVSIQPLHAAFYRVSSVSVILFGHFFFAVQIAKVERYEAKLSVMAFIGVFDELMRTVMPVGFACKLSGKTKMIYHSFGILHLFENAA